ncbi:Nitrogen regulatory protein P-II 2 [Leclercia adecarboxylata]|uniref:Nitrogen regulatory protein P-II 2 n=1 Tax=Leclercia adecarboxylata TaxID=83655 RepID=A0A4U9HKC2_9ENTR|nr:Nitrogen regulatory protein P-II 2 [Leclercia adecarboxylata]
MKLVTVVIKPFKLEDVREALSSMGIQGLTVTEVKGFGRQKGHAELYRGAEYSVNFLPKVKIDVAIADDQLDEVIDVISKAAYTGKIGDGKNFRLLSCNALFAFVQAKPTKRHCKKSGTQ